MCLWRLWGPLRLPSNRVAVPFSIHSLHAYVCWDSCGSGPSDRTSLRTERWRPSRSSHNIALLPARLSRASSHGSPPPSDLVLIGRDNGGSGRETRQVGSSQPTLLTSLRIHLGHAHKHQVRPRLSPIAPRLIWSILAIVLLLSFVLARLALPSNTALPRPRLVRQDHKPLQRTIELLPLPANYTVGSSVICLSDNFSIIVDPTINSIIPQDLQRAIDRTLDAIRLSRHTYLSIEHGEEFRLAGCNNTLSTLVLRLTLDQDVEPSTRDIPSIWDGAIVAPEERPSWESYTLDIPLHGNAAISSRTVLGLFRGLTSFANLVYFLPDDLVGDEVTGKGKGYHYLPFAPYRIEDKPSFGWRSVLLDTSRNFYSVRCIQKASLAGLGYCAMADGQILDAMSMVKLNVFHW